MDIESANQIQMVGRVSHIAQGQYLKHLVVTLTLETITKFQKINGRYETQTNQHTCMLWQRHNRNSLLSIKEGDIIKITGELKNQPMNNGYTWTRRIMIFVYDFEILGHAEDNLLAENTKANTYDE